MMTVIPLMVLHSFGLLGHLCIIIKQCKLIRYIVVLALLPFYACVCILWVFNGSSNILIRVLSDVLTVPDFSIN